MDVFGGNNQFNNPSPDPFSKFWTDCMGKMAVTGWTPSGSSSSDDAIKQMRTAFFEAWAHHCDELMRSPAFLDGMKRSMDGALAFREQLNEFMTKALHGAQAPARSDTDSILLVLRSLEERVLDRLDRLAARVESLEGRSEAGGGEPAGSKSAASRRGKGGRT